MEFTVNGVKQNYSMKLGEGGEAFFVFETTDDIPASLQTSPIVSPTGSPTQPSDEENLPASLQEPDFFDLDKAPPSDDASISREGIPMLSQSGRASSDFGAIGRDST